jgi:hypothetical protein
MLFKQNSKISFRFTREVKTIPIKAWAGLQGACKMGLPHFLDSQHMKMVRLSALYIGRLYPPGDTLGQSAVGRINSMTNADDP